MILPLHQTLARSLGQVSSTSVQLLTLLIMEPCGELQKDARKTDYYYYYSFTRIDNCLMVT